MEGTIVIADLMPLAGTGTTHYYSLYNILDV